MGTRKEGEGEGKIKAAKGVKQVKSYTFFFSVEKSVTNKHIL